MLSELPEILGRYYGALNRRDIEEMVACFALDASVRERGRLIVGRDAIRRWKLETVVKFGLRAEPVAHRQENGQSLVTVRIIGQMLPGPGQFLDAFGLSPDGLIHSMEIRPA